MIKIAVRFSEDNFVQLFHNVLNQNKRLPTIVLSFEHPEIFLRCFFQDIVEIGPQISKLVLKEVYFDKVRDFMDLLKSLPNLKTFEVIKLSYNCSRDKEFMANNEPEPVVMNNLQSFSAIIQEQSLLFFYFFVAPNIKSLTIKIASRKKHDISFGGRRRFINQLKISEKLESLEIF